MKKGLKYLLLTTCAALALGCGSMLFQPDPLYKEHAQKLREQVEKLPDGEIRMLSDITPFNWDRLYRFAPYTSAEEIYQTIGEGQRGLNIQSTVDEGMMQILFLKDQQVVCHLYGYPSQVGVSFDLGDFNGRHSLLLQAQAHPTFLVDHHSAGYSTLTLQP